MELGRLGSLDENKGKLQVEVAGSRGLLGAEDGICCSVGGGVLQEEH